MKSFDSLTSRPVTKKDNESIYYGNDPQNRPLEVLVFEQTKKPTSQILQKNGKIGKVIEEFLYWLCVYSMKKHMFVDQMVKSLLSMKNWMLNKLKEFAMKHLMNPID